MNNFVSIFEELSKLYEEDETKVVAQETEEEALTEADEAEIEIVDDETEEAPAEDAAAETVEEPKKLVLECSKCGNITCKDEADVTVDEETDLANVDVACESCEETAGYKILGELLPYGAVETVEESLDEEEELSDPAFSGTLTEGKFIDNIKKVATRVGADAATIARCFAEIINSDRLYDAAEHIENKAVLKALLNGNEKVMNSCTKDDIEDLQRDIEEYEKEKKDPTLYDIWCEDAEGQFKTYEGITEREANKEIDLAYEQHADDEHFSCWMVKHGDPADKFVHEGLFDVFKKKKQEPLKPCAPKLLADEYKYKYVVVTHNSKDFSDPQYVCIYMDRAFETMEEAEEAMDKLRKSNSYYNTSNSKVMTVSQAISKNFIRK